MYIKHTHQYPLASHSVNLLIGSFEHLASLWVVYDCFALFAWGTLGSSCIFPCTLKISHSLLKWRILEGRLIGKNIGLMVGKICDGNLKIWVDDWNVESDFNGLTLSGHYCFGSMRNSGDLSSQNWTLVRRDYCCALKRPHSLVQEIVAEFGTPDTP